MMQPYGPSGLDAYEFDEHVGKNKVTMIINFDEEKLLQAKKTPMQLLEKYENFCEKHHIYRPKINVFEKDGENALGFIGKIMCDIIETKEILPFIDTWYWDVDGVRENLLED